MTSPNSNDAITVYNYKPEGCTINSQNNFFVFENGNGEKMIFSRGTDQNVYLSVYSESRKETINLSAQFGRRYYAQAFDVLLDSQGNIVITLAISTKSMLSKGKVYISRKIKKEELGTIDWKSAIALFSAAPDFSFSAEIINLSFAQKSDGILVIADAKKVGDFAGVDHYFLDYSKNDSWKKVPLPEDVKNPSQILFGMHGKPAVWSLYAVGHEQTLQWTAPAIFSDYPTDVSQPYKNLPSRIHYVKNIQKAGSKFDDLLVAGDGLFLYADKSNTAPVQLLKTGKNIRKMDCLSSTKTEQYIVLLNADNSMQLYVRNLAGSLASEAVTFADKVENFCIIGTGKQPKIAVLTSGEKRQIQFYELKDQKLVLCDEIIGLDPIWNVPPLTAQELASVISENGPKLYFHSKERFFMSKVDYYLKSVGCWDDVKKEWLHRPGSLWDEAQNDMKPIVFPADTPENMNNIWLKIPDNPKDSIIDKEVLKAGRPDSECEAYTHAKFTEQEDCTDIQFWFFYPFNGAGSAYVWLPTESSERVDLDPLGIHEGDWEHVTIRIDNYTMKLVGAWMSQHGDHIWIEEKKIEKEGGKPLFYASRHGHANYSSAGANLAPDFEVENICHFGLRNDTDKSGRFLECSHQYNLLSAAFLDEPPVEPNWLQFKFRWGAKFVFEQQSIEDLIRDNLPRTLRVVVGLLPGGFLINNLLLEYLFPNVVYNKLMPEGEKYSAGPPGPKKKGAWLKDESLGG